MTSIRWSAGAVTQCEKKHEAMERQRKGREMNKASKYESTAKSGSRMKAVARLGNERVGRVLRE